MIKFEAIQNFCKLILVGIVSLSTSLASAAKDPDFAVDSNTFDKWIESQFNGAGQTNQGSSSRQESTRPDNKGNVQNNRNNNSSSSSIPSLPGINSSRGSSFFGTSSAKRRVLPDDFECPIFSNSPYTDVLIALDSLQSNIGAMECEQGKNQAMDLSVQLKKIVEEAQANDQAGNTRKLGLSAQDLLSKAGQLQEFLTEMASDKANNCYKQSKPKNLLFNINAAYQSISPLALDFISKNPGLATVLKPYMPIILGTEAMSKGLTVLETTLKSMKTVNMDNREEQIALVKNTCSFMKLYSRYEYLTLNRDEQKMKIEKEFDAKIKKNNEHISLMSSTHVLRAPIASNMADAQIINKAENYKKYDSAYAKASAELKNISFASTQNFSRVCSTLRTLYRLNLTEGIVEDFSDLTEMLNKQKNNSFMLERFQGMDEEFQILQTSGDAESCAETGKDWLDAGLDLLGEMHNMLTQISHQTQSSLAELIGLGSSNSSPNRSEISRLEKENENLAANRQKLKVFSSYSAFEPSIVAKSMREMPKFLFNGPDGSWFAKLTKNGPVHDFLKDNEAHFKDRLAALKKQVNALQAFEMSMLAKEFPKGAKAGGAKEINDYLARMEYYKNNYPHLDKKYLASNPLNYRKICDQVALARTAYNEALSHLISSDSMCKMVDPVLKEETVSVWLKRYCRDSEGLVVNLPVTAGYKVMALPLMGSKGLKTQVDNITKKLDTLDCE